MSEIAKCPICGKEPEVWCRDEEIRIRIVCCKHAAYSTPGWNQYAAAMELAKTKQKRETIGRNIFGDWDEYDEKLWQAERRVLKVFK